MWRILVIPGSGQALWQCPCRALSCQDIPLCHGLVNNLQDMLNLGAVILLCVVSLFLLPYSNLLPAMQRCGVRAKEEIEGVGSVVWRNGKAPG